MCRDVCCDTSLEQVCFWDFLRNRISKRIMGMAQTMDFCSWVQIDGRLCLVANSQLSAKALPVCLRSKEELSEWIMYLTIDFLRTQKKWMRWPESCRRGAVGLMLLHQVHLRALKMTNPPKKKHKKGKWLRPMRRHWVGLMFALLSLHWDLVVSSQVWRGQVWGTLP